MNQTIQKIFEEDNYIPNSLILVFFAALLIAFEIEGIFADIAFYILLSLFSLMIIYYIFSRGIKSIITEQYDNPNPIVFMSLIIIAFTIQVFADVSSYWSLLFYISLTCLFLFRYFKHKCTTIAETIRWLIRKSVILILIAGYIFALIIAVLVFSSFANFIEYSILFLLYIFGVAAVLLAPLSYMWLNFLKRKS